jgi:hypothetical protein
MPFMNCVPGAALQHALQQVAWLLHYSHKAKQHTLRSKFHCSAMIIPIAIGTQNSDDN